VVPTVAHPAHCRIATTGQVQCDGAGFRTCILVVTWRRRYL
jgi:hypothetical protein